MGFTRVDAPDPDADEQANIVYLNKGKSEKWLPAAEVNGEGIFIEFNKESIRAQRIRMGWTQEELAEKMCVPKSTISAYENDRVDIKSSVIVELSELLETTPNHLLGTGEYDTDILEILGVLKKMSPKLKKVALEQIKALSSVC